MTRNQGEEHLPPRTTGAWQLPVVHVVVVQHGQIGSPTVLTTRLAFLSQNLMAIEGQFFFLDGYCGLFCQQVNLISKKNYSLGFCPSTMDWSLATGSSPPKELVHKFLEICYRWSHA